MLILTFTPAAAAAAVAGEVAPVLHMRTHKGNQVPVMLTSLSSLTAQATLAAAGTAAATDANR
jgi:hypothetical protein